MLNGFNAALATIAISSFSIFSPVAFNVSAPEATISIPVPHCVMCNESSEL